MRKGMWDGVKNKTMTVPYPQYAYYPRMAEYSRALILAALREMEKSNEL